MQNPNGTAFQTNLVPTIESGSTLAPELRQRDLADFPVSAGCSRSHVKIQLGQCGWQKERGKVLPAPLGRVYPQCLGSASCSPRPGAGGLNTRKKQKSLTDAGSIN